MKVTIKANEKYIFREKSGPVASNVIKRSNQIKNAKYFNIAVKRQVLL